MIFYIYSGGQNLPFAGGIGSFCRVVFAGGECGIVAPPPRPSPAARERELHRGIVKDSSNCQENKNPLSRAAGEGDQRGPPPQAGEFLFFLTVRCVFIIPRCSSLSRAAGEG
jgi:hypothetical protein